MYVKFGKMLVPLTEIASEEGVETWATDVQCPGCREPFVGLLLSSDSTEQTRSMVLDTNRITCANCGTQFHRVVPEGHNGAMIPAGEGEVRDLHLELTALEARRRVINERLAEISRKHIEVHKAEPIEGMTGDAALFADMTKARLMQIIEQHWSIHHMGAIHHFEHLTKADLVNMIISIKGLSGHYEKPPPKARTAMPGKRKASDISF
jgi:hypothetical protein